MSLITVSKNEEGIKLFRLVLQNYKSSSKILIYKLCRKGVIRLNQKRCSGKEILKAGDILKIPSFLSNNLNFKKQEQGNIFNLKDLEELRKTIIYSDDDIVIFNKPANLSVQGGTGIKKSIDKMAIELFPYSKISLVHRLDKETSGILIVAKNQQSAQKLSKQFQNKKVHKEYLAILSGKISNNFGVINNFISDKKVYDKYQKDKNFKSAITEYKVLSKINNLLSLVLFIPKTGRTHQLRLHSSQTLKAPILGDKLYSKEPFLSNINTDKLFLFAYKISFFHPITNKPMNIKAELPNHFKDVLKLLEIKL